MTGDGYRTGPVRDVPPPRPVPALAPAPEETGLGRAARAVAEAVAGLVGPAGGRPGDAAGTRRWSAATGLRDVAGAVAGAVGAAFGPDREAAATPPAGGAASSADGTAGALLGDLLSAAAPRLPIRDAALLRQAHPGASDREIADVLVARAARLTSTIGAATGGVMAAHWFAPASLIALPLELGAETLLVAGVEVVLIGELHELYGRRPPGDARARANAYVASWSSQRSLDGTGAAGLGSLLGGAGMRSLQRRMTRKLTGAVPTAAPFLIGAALGGRGNRRATETLAERVLGDLRAACPPGSDS